MWQVTGSYIGGPLCLIGFIIMLLKHKTKINIRDKVVVITGATSGLGKACSFVFCAAGCRVILAGRSLQKLQELQLELQSSNKSEHKTEIVVLDLEDEKSIIEGVETAYKINNQINILINNAGVSYRGTILTTTLNVHKKIMQINYFGQVLLTKCIVEKMKTTGGGHVVGISSVQGKLSIPFRSAYSASKHAFQAFCDCLRAECADDSIKVSVISPGYIQTNLSKNAIQADGSNYGVLDESTASGMKAEYVAQQVLTAVEYQTKEVLLSTMGPKIACYLRTIAPSIFFWLMNSRARKMNKST